MTNGFDKLLREGLDAQGAHDTGECVDAALLAAWFDGTLSHQERTAVEAHAASCSRCQAMIAALVRTDRPAPRSVWRAPAMRWLVPLAVAAAAALVLWIGVSPERREPAPASTTARLEAPTPPTAQSPGSAGARVSPADSVAVVATPPPLVRSAQDVTPATGAKAEGRTDAEARLRSAETAPMAAPPSEPLKERPAEVPMPAAPAPPLPAASAAPAPPPPPASAPESAKASAPPSQPVGQVAEAAGGSVVVSAPQANFTTADAAARPLARSVAESVTSAGRAGSGGTVIITPDRTAQWRITGTGLVQRSNDGMTWQTQATGVSQALMAGAAPSRSVCWLVGQHGVVLRTSDGGRTWARIAFPEELDLVTVAAADDQVATVTSASGRQLQTTDGGKSWR